MKLEVNRLIMLEAAKCVAKIAPSNSPSELLNNIMIEGNDDTGEIILTATNHEVSIIQKIIASVSESGSMLVHPRMLTGMMSLLEGEFVSMSAERPDILTVKGGTCRYQIRCQPSNSYPKPIIPFPEESVIMTGICSLAKRTTFLVSTNDAQPLSLHCVNIKLKNNAVHAAASDGNRMMFIKDAAEPTDEQEFLLPGRGLSILASISKDSDVFEVSDIGKEVVFVRGDMVFSIRKYACDDYMDTAALIKKLKPVYTAVTEVGHMKEALNVMSVAALSGETIVPINLLFSGSEIVLRCVSDFSSSNTAVHANVTQDTPEDGFYYDVSALLKLFNVLNGKVKLELDAKGFMLVKTRSEVYLQAPVRGAAFRKKADDGNEKKKKSAKGAKEMKEAA